MVSETAQHLILYGSRVTLRAPQNADKVTRLSYGRDPQFRRMVGGDPNTDPPLAAEEVNHWYEGIASDPLHWIIDLDGSCVGTVRLHSLDEQNKRARFAIGIFSPIHRGPGPGDGSDAAGPGVRLRRVASPPH